MVLTTPEPAYGDQADCDDVCKSVSVEDQRVGAVGKPELGLAGAIAVMDRRDQPESMAELVEHRCHQVVLVGLGVGIETEVPALKPRVQRYLQVILRVRALGGAALVATTVGALVLERQRGVHTARSGPAEMVGERGRVKGVLEWCAGKLRLGRGTRG